MNEKMLEAESFSFKYSTNCRKRFTYCSPDKAEEKRKALIPLSLFTLIEVRKAAWAKPSMRDTERQWERARDLYISKASRGGREKKMGRKETEVRETRVRGKGKDWEGTPILGYAAHHKLAAWRVILS